MGGETSNISMEHQLLCRRCPPNFLTVADKAGNVVENWVTVKVDNTPPTINSLTWVPPQPKANETVKVYVQIADNGSGVKSATLWFKRLDDENWQKKSMNLENGNWTATIHGFEEETTVIFYVECSDKTGNRAISPMKHYVVEAAEVVKGFEGLPLYWLAAAVFAILAVLASTAYYLKKRKRASSASTFMVSSL